MNKEKSKPIFKNDEWNRIVDKMETKGRFFVFCPKCKKKKFMRFFQNDDICDFYCFGCKTYFTKKYLGERECST